jgi:RNA recognition motif-containing protein
MNQCAQHGVHPCAGICIRITPGWTSRSGDTINIYVGNLSDVTDEKDIRHAFEVYGEVFQVSIINDRISGLPKGFGFVEMPIKEQANAAILNLNGKEFDGHPLKVNEARPATERPVSVNLNQNNNRGGGGGFRRGR